MQQAIQSHFARFSSDFLPKIEHTLRDKRRTLAGSASENSDCRRRCNPPKAKINTRETDEVDMPQNRLAEIHVCSEENYRTVICTQIIVYLFRDLHVVRLYRG
jgi:hypothetical protein